MGQSGFYILKLYTEMELMNQCNFFAWDLLLINEITVT